MIGTHVLSRVMVGVMPGVVTGVRGTAVVRSERALAGDQRRSPDRREVVELADGNLYLAIGVRNGGSGLAVIHGWRASPGESATAERPDPSEFRRQQRDLYIPAGDSGFWQGPIRDSDDPAVEPLRAALADKQPLIVDLLYGDHEGGQRTITRFGIREWPGSGGRRSEVLRYWNLDRDDPRGR